jgi:predicted nucleotidyltransferase
MRTTLDHLPERNQQEIRTLVSLLQETFKASFSHTSAPGKRGGRILKIILFGSYAKGSWVNDPAHGYVSDYDVLVVVNNEKLVEDYRFWNRVEERVQAQTPACALCAAGAALRLTLSTGYEVPPPLF